MNMNDVLLNSKRPCVHVTEKPRSAHRRQCSRMLASQPDHNVWAEIVVPSDSSPTPIPLRGRSGRSLGSGGQTIWEVAYTDHLQALSKTSGLHIPIDSWHEEAHYV